MHSSLHAAPAGRHGPAHAGHRALPAASLLLFVLAGGDASASFGGSLHISPLVLFLVAAAVALPGALILFLIELIGGRRRRPVWPGLLALVAWIWCAARVLGLGPRGDVAMFLFPLPVLMTLALVCLMPRASVRLVAAWVVSVGAVAAMALEPEKMGLHGEGRLPILLGGAFISMFFWQFAWWLGRRAAASNVRRVSERIEARPVSRSHGTAFGRAAGTVDTRMQIPGAAPPPPPAPEAWIPPAPRPAIHPGWLWFAGGAALLYVTIAILTAAGIEAPWKGLTYVQTLVYDLFALPFHYIGNSAVKTWAVQGVPWAMLAGVMAWGWGAVAGMFDAGRLHSVRLAAALVPVIAFGVAGAMISVMPRI